MTSCAGVFEIEDALVDGDHAVDQRHLEVQAGLGDDADRLAEPDHERLLGLIDGEQRRVAEHDRGDEEGRAATPPAIPSSHRAPPLCVCVRRPATVR